MSVSSYNKSVLDFSDIFKVLIKMVKPKSILEFGILNGYSLKVFADNVDKSTEIYAYDIFDDFNGHHADQVQITQQFQNYPNVSIQYGNFYGMCHLMTNKFDIIHIDIANDASTYEFAIDNYLPLLNPNGILILEGGSVERDNVEWMKKYNKKSINDFLKTKCGNLDYFIIDKFPSITVICGAARTAYNQPCPPASSPLLQHPHTI